MADLNPGDVVICNIKNGCIASFAEPEPDCQKQFEIVIVNEYDIYLCIPDYYNLHIDNKLEITEHNYIKHKLLKKFIGATLSKVSPFNIFLIHSKCNGTHCAKCEEFYPYAEANQDDGSLVCWSCRNYPMYKGRL